MPRPVHLPGRNSIRMPIGSLSWRQAGEPHGTSISRCAKIRHSRLLRARQETSRSFTQARSARVRTAGASTGRRNSSRFRRVGARAISRPPCARLGVRCGVAVLALSVCRSCARAKRTDVSFGSTRLFYYSFSFFRGTSDSFETPARSCRASSSPTIVTGFLVPGCGQLPNISA